MQQTLNFLMIGLVLLCVSCQEIKNESVIEEMEKFRTVILTDMTHDDGNSLVRFLYYSSYFDLEALIITPQLPDFTYDAIGPWDKGASILNAYREELPQLQKHDKNLPTYDELMAVTKKGNGALPIIWLTNTLKFSDNIANRYVTSSWDSIYFHDWIGEGLNPHGLPKDSEGSDLLVAVFEKEDDRPIYVQAWGGTVTFVQALHSFRKKNGDEKFKELLPKLHLFGILFQDITFEFFADFKKMEEETCADFGTAIPTYEKAAVELGMVMYDEGHFWHYVFGRDSTWKKPLTAQEVNAHGPMSKIYDNGGEGDTPSFLYLLSAVFGLHDPLDPTQGSWGSMFKPMGSSFSENYFATCEVSQKELSRWDEDVNNNFKNRLLWSIKDPSDVNREPQSVINGDYSNKIIKQDAKVGEEITLDASASSDPDGDSLTFKWYRYHEADTYSGNFELVDHSNSKQKIKIPEDLGKENIHLVLEVRDSGMPSLVTYRRVIIRENTDYFDPNSQPKK